MKSIFDRSFVYTNAAKTDIRKTFARVRKEQQAQQALRAALPDKENKVIRMKAIERGTK